MRVARHDALAVIDPDLAAPDAIERRGGGVTERQRFVERDVLLLAGPIEEARIDADDLARRRREHGGPGRGGEVDAFVNPRAIVARRARHETRIVRYVAAFERHAESTPEACVRARAPIADLRSERRYRRQRRMALRHGGARGRTELSPRSGCGHRDHAEQDHAHDRQSDAHHHLRYLYFSERHHPLRTGPVRPGRSAERPRCSHATTSAGQSRGSRTRSSSGTVISLSSPSSASARAATRSPPASVTPSV